MIEDRTVLPQMSSKSCKKESTTKIVYTQRWLSSTTHWSSELLVLCHKSCSPVNFPVQICPQIILYAGLSIMSPPAAGTNSMLCTWGDSVPDPNSSHAGEWSGSAQTQMTVELQYKLVSGEVCCSCDTGGRMNYRKEKPEESLGTITSSMKKECVFYQCHVDQDVLVFSSTWI